MRFNFKRITAIGATLLMAGMTAGIAAAATFPAPFVTNGVANVAVVYGTGAGVSPTDMVEAGNIQTTLGESMPSSGGATTVDGDSYKFEKTSTKYHIGDYYVNLTTNLDEDELPNLLADGKYVDNDKDEFDYTQKITMGALNYLSMFEDSDYMEDVPTVGFRIPSSQTILTYQITFSDTPLLSDMSTSDLPFMGKTYYVLSNTSTTLTLLDSATETILSEGGTATVDGKTIVLDYIDDDEVVFSVDGVTTGSLAEAQTIKLADGSYLGIKDIRAQNYEGGVKKVEFSIGTGKLKLTDGGSTEVQINDNAVSGIVADFDLTGDVLTSINVTWSADDDTFITEDTEATMPGFEIVKLSYGGATYPAEELIEVRKGGDTYARLENFPLIDGEADIDFLYGNSTWFTAIGKDATNLLLTDANDDGNITFNGNNLHSYFVASWTDTNDAESYLMRATNFVIDGTDNKTDIQYYKNGAWVDKKTGAKATDTLSIGSVDLTIGAVSKLGSTKTVEIWKTNSNTATSITSFNTLYSAEGLTVYLPWVNATALNITDSTNKTAIQACDAARSWTFENDGLGEIGYAGVVTYNNTADGVAAGAQTEATVTCTPDVATFNLKVAEEDRSGNKYAGDYFNVTLGWDSSSTPIVEVTDIVNEEVAFIEIEDTDVWRSFMYSALATELLWDKPSSGQNSLKIMYHGDEVAADVYIASPDATITSGGASTLGNILVTDAEIDSVKTKNLIIVGGSCINSAAAGLLGSACGSSFTTATGIGAGQFLIQSFGDAYTTGKIALLVAGYELADTKNAATYLRTQIVDTTAGNKYVGTSGTEATLQVS